MSNPFWGSAPRIRWTETGTSGLREVPSLSFAMCRATGLECAFGFSQGLEAFQPMWSVGYVEPIVL